MKVSGRNAVGLALGVDHTLNSLTRCAKDTMVMEYVYHAESGRPGQDVRERKDGMDVLRERESDERQATTGD